MFGKNNEISIPSDLKIKNNTKEIIRIWIENDKQKFYLKTDVWEDPAAWGLLLVDLVVWFIWSLILTFFSQSTLSLKNIVIIFIVPFWVQR